MYGRFGDGRSIMKRRSIVISAMLAVLLLGVSSQAQAFFFSFGFGGWGHPYYSAWGHPGYWGPRYNRGYAYGPYYARYYRRHGPYTADAFRRLPAYGYPLMAGIPVNSSPKVVEK